MPRFLENSPNIQSFEKFPKSYRLYHPQIPKGIWGISQMPGYLGISQMSFLIKTVNAIVSWHQQDTLTRCENRNAENRWFILSIFIYTILKLIYQKAVGFLRLFASLPYLINNMSDIYLPKGVGRGLTRHSVRTQTIFLMHNEKYTKP